MKRITIVRVAPVLVAFFAAFAMTGCLGQTSTSSDGTDESSLVSQRSHDVANGKQPNAAEVTVGPARVLELTTSPSDENQGPHPEPWLDQQGPHPEPWFAKKLLTQPDPNSPNTPKP